MQNSLHKLIQIILLILGLTSLSFAMDEEPSDEYCEISLNVQGSILEQQESFGESIKSAQKEIAPEEVVYDIPKELQPTENIYRVPEVKNYCGYVCGRCHFACYTGEHPNKDCFDYWSACSIDTFISMFVSNLISAGVSGGLLGIYGNIGLVPILTTGPISCCMIMHFFTSLGSIVYANRMAEQDYRDSYHRGLLCLPEDPCSCTSCTGVSYLKQRESCLSMRKSCSIFWGGVRRSCCDWWGRLC